MNIIRNTVAYLGISLACILLVSQPSYAGIAGYAQFVNGDVQIVSPAGQTRALQKGSAVNEDDTLISAQGASAQIKIQDGGFVAVRPDTRLKIDSFQFTGKEDGSEKIFISLFKGGFRAVTGLIGRLNKPNYRITTAAATIGIRGTDHETFVVTPDSPLANAAPGTYNKVNVGETYMTTDQGTIYILPNQMGFAGAANLMPQLQPLNTDIFTVPAQPTAQAMGDKKAAVRDTAVVDPNQQVQAVETIVPPTGIDTLTIPVCATDLATGQCTTLTTATSSPLPASGGNGITLTTTLGLNGIETAVAPHAAGTPPSPSRAELLTFGPGLTYTFDATGLTRADYPQGGFIDRGTTQLVEAGWDNGVIHWGRWSNGIMTAGGWYNGLNFGPNQGWHFIVGIPTNVDQMPVNATVTYTLIGGTSPTPSDGAGAGLGLGQLISGSATANFTNATINGNLVMGFNGSSIYQTNYSGSLGTAGQNLTGTTTFQNGAINVCGTAGCSTQLQGQFYGANATDLGVGYIITTNQSFNINGVAAYRR